MWLDGVVWVATSNKAHLCHDAELPPWRLQRKAKRARTARMEKKELLEKERPLPSELEFIFQFNI